MAELRIDSAVSGDIASVLEDFSVAPMSTDGASESKETEYVNEKWSQQFGYYKQIPELRASIDAKATWTIGKGFIADEVTTLILDSIKGWGKDTFNTILENMKRTMDIGGDAFAEIIRDEDEVLSNLKPLDPNTIKIVADSKGIILRYEQVGKNKKPNKRFEVEDILHLARNRVADEIHGVSLIDPLEDIILARGEAMADMKTLMHRHVTPRIIWKLDTDDPTKIAKIKATNDAADANRENMYIPKDAVDFEILAIPANATLNPLPWIESLNAYFFQATGVPQIIVGGSQEFTEATAKIAYLAFQQTVEEDQLFIEEQINLQLNIRIELEFPASLENELLSDNKKDGAENIDPSDTTAQPVQQGTGKQPQ